jgi:hypothetical protein
MEIPALLPKEPKAPTVTLTLEQLREMIVFAATEFRKPTEAEQEKLDKEKALFDRKRKEGIEMAKLEEEQRKLAQDQCPHKKPNGESTIHIGQIYSDGKLRPICVRCQMMLSPRDAPKDMLVTGLAQ